MPISSKFDEFDRFFVDSSSHLERVEAILGVLKIPKQCNAWPGHLERCLERADGIGKSRSTTPRPWLKQRLQLGFVVSSMIDNFADERRSTSCVRLKRPSLDFGSKFFR